MGILPRTSPVSARKHTPICLAFDIFLLRLSAISFYLSGGYASEPGPRMSPALKSVAAIDFVVIAASGTRAASPILEATR